MLKNIISFFLRKILNFYSSILRDENIVIGTGFQLKKNSRIQRLGKEGEVFIGKNFSIGYNSELFVWEGKLVIGDNTSINDNCKIYNNISIGSNCLLASNIFMSSGSHIYNFKPFLPIKKQDKLANINKPVIVEDDCWIGFGVVIMPGVNVGKGAIVGANAVVTKDIYPYTINAGIPCKEIGKRLDFKNLNEIINSNELENLPYFYKGFNYNQYDDLNTFKEGAEVIKKTSVVLLARVPMNKIKIVGFNYNLNEFEISLNNTFKSFATVPKGRFEIVVDLQKSIIQKCFEFESLSSAVKENFNVLIIKSQVNCSSQNGSQCLWKINSIGNHD